MLGLRHGGNLSKKQVNSLIYSDEVLLRNAQILNVLFKLRPILQKMSYYGIPLSKEVLAFKSADFRKQITEHWKRCFDIVGERYNPDSTDQVKRILYDVLGLPIVQIRDGGRLKVTTNKFALGKLHYEVKEALKGNQSVAYNEKYTLEDIDEFLYEHRRAKKLRQALSGFIDSLLDLHPCPHCDKGFTDKAKKNICPHCAKTGFSGVKSYDPHFVSDKDGIWHAHPSILPLQVSGRLSTLDKNFAQFKRNDRTWDISVRSVVAAPKGFKLIMTDVNKAERLVGSILFNSDKMLDEVRRGAAAVSEFAMRAFGLPYEETVKGTEAYQTAKTCLYATQYMCQAETLHETLLADDIYFPVEKCAEIIRLIESTYDDYYHNVKDVTWRRLNGDGVVRTYQGRLFRMSMPPELSNVRNWKDIERYRQPEGVRKAWAQCCRMVASLMTQGSATGDGCLVMLLKTTDAIYRYLNPEWNEIRFWNGNWDIARPVITKHDEIITLCRDDLVDDVQKIQEEKMMSFEELEPYLENSKSSVRFGVKVETDICQYWDVPLEETNEFEGVVGKSSV